MMIALHVLRQRAVASPLPLLGGATSFANDVAEREGFEPSRAF